MYFVFTFFLFLKIICSDKRGKKLSQNGKQKTVSETEVVEKLVNFLTKCN